MRRLVSALVIILIFLVAGYILLIYATGKRLGSNGKLVGVGIIQVEASPNGAKVYLDNNFVDNANTNIENLKPGSYTIKISKDHYHTWQKEVEVKEGIITPLKVALFPVNPSLNAATFDGVISPKISPDKNKIVFGTTTQGKAGLYVLEIGSKQLFFTGSNNQRQVIPDSDTYQFSTASVSWSPDSSQILVEVKNKKDQSTQYFLLDENQSNANPTNVTKSIEKTKTDWATQVSNSNTSKLKSLGSGAVELAKDNHGLIFSKDDLAVIILKADSSAVVYDTKPTPVPGVKPLTTELPVAKGFSWLQNGTKHVLVVDENVISLMDTDATNKTSVFTGDFDPSAVFASLDGSQVLMSINLNSRTSSLPNLWSINVR